MFYSVKEITTKNRSKIYESLMELVYEYEESGYTKRIDDEGVYLSDKMEDYLSSLKERKLIDSFDIIDLPFESMPNRDVGMISVCYVYDGKMEHFIVDWEN